MKGSRIFLFIALISMFVGLSQTHAANQKTSGVKPEKFAPGIISTDAYEMSATFTPDGKTVYFARAKDVQLSSFAIYVSHWADGKWSIPVIAEFSGKYNDMDPFVSPDGKRIYFTSNRPLDGAAEPKPDFDIWVVEKTGDGWGEPKNIGLPVNTDKSEFHPSVAANGNLYFALKDSPNRWLVCKAEWKNGAYQKPEKFAPEVNSSPYNFDPYIDPQERYMIFTQYNFEQNDDQTISYNVNGSWTTAEFLPVINTVFFELCPYVSSDGKTLYFTRSGDIYSISLDKLGIK